MLIVFYKNTNKVSHIDKKNIIADEDLNQFLCRPRNNPAIRGPSAADEA